MIVAVLMVGSGAAALGSACNDAADAQNLNLPAILPALIPLFLLGPVLQQPNSAIATWLSLVPPFTPILMFMRQSMPGGVPEWQPIVGLAGVVLFTVFSIWIASRIFRVGLLMQGKPPSVTGILKWVIRG
ncbi:MAG: ABC transporter permease [Calditrichota bacterium]